MSAIKPARRWQPAFYPFHRVKMGHRVLARLELMVKGPVFGCRMCGNCLLQETAFICPMECPKGLRNGPCGGITPGGRCYVDDSRKCVWLAIYKRAGKTGRQEKLLEVLPPLDWQKTGCDTWGDVIREVRKVGAGRFFSATITGNRKEKDAVWDSVFMTIRQPSWWQGDSQYHPPAESEPVSQLERDLRSGKFVVATEVTPPLGTSIQKLNDSINTVKKYVSAINFTDGSSARPRMSSLACSIAAVNQGAEPVFQVASRDTTRTGLLSEAIGLNSLGIKNVLCVTGDNPSVGPSPVSSMNFVDLDSVQMLWILRRLMEKGLYPDGTEIKTPPSFFLGAGSSPLSMEPSLQAIRDQKKVNAGARFIQTNIVFEPDRLDPWLEQLDKRNVLDKVFILAGVTPLKGIAMARYLDSRVPGISVPGRVMTRMEKAGEKGAEEGILIALEIIDRLKGKKGIRGIHLMTLGRENDVERIVRESGLNK